MAPSQGDILYQHTQQIAAIQVEMGTMRGRLESLDDRYETFRDMTGRLSDQIGEAPRPDEGVEGHGLARAIAALTDRIEPIIEEREKAAKEKTEGPIRLRANISTFVAIIALVFTILTFATKATPSSSAADMPTTAVVDASNH